MTFSWRIAEQTDFHKVNKLLIDAGQCWDKEHLYRRVVLPLFLEQLIIFEDKDRICGFLTYALMNGVSACHQAVIGVFPADWRSGEQLWVVDFVALGGDGDKMLAKLKEDIRNAVKSPLRWFRVKRKAIKRVELIQGDMA